MTRNGAAAIHNYIDGLEYGESRESDLWQFYEYCLENDIEFLGARVHDLEAWAETLDDEGYAGRTIREKISSVRGMYTALQNSNEHDWYWAEPRENYYVDDENDDGIDLEDYDIAPQTWIDNPKSALYIEVDEYEQMLDAADLPRDDLLCRILWETGIRAKEASRIECSHVAKDRKSIEIKNAKKTPSTKGEDRWRTVYLPESTAVRLREWMDKGGRASYSTAEYSPMLFVTLRSQMMSPHAVNRRIRKLAEWAGIQEQEMTTVDGRKRYKVTSHCMRRSFAVHRVRNGMPIVTLAELLGHSLLETSRIYLKFVDSDIREMNQRYRP